MLLVISCNLDRRESQVDVVNFVEEHCSSHSGAILHDYRKELGDR